MKLTQNATYWTLAASFTLLIGMSSAFAQNVHICEELMKQEHTESDFEKCIKEFGEPESFKTDREQQRRSEEARAESERERKMYFDKVFTEAELRRFGAPYVAKRNYYDFTGRIYKTKTLSDEKDLCQYLGFDKNLGSGSLSDIMEDFEHQNFVGVRVRNQFMRSLEAQQFRFDESDDPSNIQIFTSLKCRRDRKKGDPESSVVSVVSSTEAMNEAIQPSSSASQQSARNDSQRRGPSVLDANSPYLYKPQSASDSSNR